MEVFLYFLLVGFAVKKLCDARHSIDDGERKRKAEADNMKFVSVYNKVHEMNRAVEEIEKLEQFITDIECCDSTHMKAIQIEVPNAVGNSSKHQILIDGSDSHSNRLLAIALEDRKKMRDALLSDIEALYLSNGVTTAETKATRKNANQTTGE